MASWITSSQMHLDKINYQARKDSSSMGRINSLNRTARILQGIKNDTTHNLTSHQSMVLENLSSRCMPKPQLVERPY